MDEVERDNDRLPKALGKEVLNPSLDHLNTIFMEPMLPSVHDKGTSPNISICRELRIIIRCSVQPNGFGFHPFFASSSKVAQPFVDFVWVVTMPTLLSILGVV